MVYSLHSDGGLAVIEKMRYKIQLRICYPNIGCKYSTYSLLCSLKIHLPHEFFSRKYASVLFNLCQCNSLIEIFDHYIWSASSSNLHSVYVCVFFYFTFSVKYWRVAHLSLSNKCFFFFCKFHVFIYLFDKFFMKTLKLN